MGVRDIVKSRQLSTQLFCQKVVKAIVKSIGQPKFFFKAIVKSIIFATNLSRQMSSQLCDTIFFQGNCQANYLLKIILYFLSIIGILG